MKKPSRLAMTVTCLVLAALALGVAIVNFRMYGKIVWECILIAVVALGFGIRYAVGAEKP